MADIYMNGVANIDETTNPVTCKDGDEIEEHDIVQHGHFKSLQKDFTNIERDDNVTHIEGKGSNDSSINGCIDGVNISPVIGEEAIAFSTKDTVKSLDVDCIVDSTGNQEIQDSTDKLNSNNDKVDSVCDEDITNKRSGENETNILTSSNDITITAVPSEAVTNIDILICSDEVAEDVLKPNDEIAILCSDDVADPSNTSDGSNESYKNDKSVIVETNVSHQKDVFESQVISVDDETLSESYIKISLDEGDSSVAGEHISGASSAHQELSNTVTDILNKDIDNPIPDSQLNHHLPESVSLVDHGNSTDTKNIISVGDKATCEISATECNVVDDVSIEMTNEVINEVDVSAFVNKIIEDAKKLHLMNSAAAAANDSDGNITVENISVLEASLNDEPIESVPIDLNAAPLNDEPMESVPIDLNADTNSLTTRIYTDGEVSPAVSKTEDSVIDFKHDSKNNFLETSTAGIIDDAKFMPVEIVSDSKSSSVEIISDSKSAPVEIVSDSKSTPVEIIHDSKSIEIVDDSKLTSVEINDNKTVPEKPEDSDTPEDEWLDILGNNLLRKKIIVKGTGKETRPVVGDIVKVRCEGRLSDGTIVDKSSNLQFVLSDEDVIQAFDLAVALMEDKEVATVFTDARYAYGIHGRPDYTPPIPQNASINYEIEILSVEKGPDLENMTSEERVLYGDKKRIRGNDLYVREEYAGSINAYKRGIKYLEGTDDENVMSMKMKCLNNLSAAQLQVKAFRMAIQSLDTVLQFEPENVKALFRKGKCLNGLKKEEEALEYIKKASMLDPQNKTILQELGRLRSRLAVTHQKEKEMYQKMFQQKKGEKISKEEENLNWSVKITSMAVAALGVIAGYLWYKNR